MRLPGDDEEGAEIVRRAADLGINYFETSIGYVGGRSEVMVGMGVKNCRDKVYVSTKSNVLVGSTPDDLKRNFYLSLDRLQMDRLDFYQVWDYRTPEYEDVMKKGGGLDTIEKLKAEGLIDHIGLTTHVSNDEIIRLLDTGRFESVTISYHMMKRDHEPVIRYAAEKGIGVVIMNPLGGGMLAAGSDAFSRLVPGRSLSGVAVALSFLMTDPRISTIPSGMTSVAEVEENVRIWADFRPFTHEEHSDLLAGIEKYQELGREYCTACGYCMPCPNGVNIPRLFQIRNYRDVFGMRDWADRMYRKIKPTMLPENCTECGECEGKCPNGIPIIKQLKEVAEMFKGVRD
jgi:hypothetical protein